MAQNPKYSDKGIFLLCNTGGVEQAKQYKAQRQLSDACLHGACDPPAAYGLQYIPHKTIVDGTGKVVKNFKDVSLARDVDPLL